MHRNKKMESLRPKTGLIGDNNNAIEEMKTRLIGLVCLMMKMATKTSFIFCTHQGRDVVTADDTKKALKYTAMNFFKTDSLEQDLEDMLHDMDTWKEETEDESLDDPSPVFEKLLDTIEEDIGSSCELNQSRSKECDCAMCVDMQSIESSFDAWEPQDEVEVFLKHHLENLNYLSEDNDMFEASLT